MAHATSPCRARQVGQLRQRFAHAPALPFAESAPRQAAEQAIRDEAVSFRDRLFSPLVTLWVFLSQVLDPDHSCRQAVARFLAWRTAPGIGTVFHRHRRLLQGPRPTARSRAGTPDVGPPAGRPKSVPPPPGAGTTTPSRSSMAAPCPCPNSPANQKAFPQARTQKAGVGFPIARLVVLFSLAVGTVLDAALGRYQGKRTGETALFHGLHDHLEAGDILLADRYFAPIGSWPWCGDGAPTWSVACTNAAVPTSARAGVWAARTTS